MTETNIQFDAASSERRVRPIVFMNLFTPKAGRLNELIAVQTAAQSGYFGTLPGLLGHRIHRALDGKTVLVLARFESVEHHQRALQSDVLREHIRRVAPLIERAERGYFDVVAEIGDV